MLVGLGPGLVFFVLSLRVKLTFRKNWRKQCCRFWTKDLMMTQLVDSKPRRYRFFQTTTKPNEILPRPKRNETKPGQASNLHNKTKRNNFGLRNVWESAKITIQIRPKRNKTKRNETKQNQGQFISDRNERKRILDQIL